MFVLSPQKFDWYAAQTFHYSELMIVQ